MRFTGARPEGPDPVSHQFTGAWPRRSQPLFTSVQRRPARRPRPLVHPFGGPRPRRAQAQAHVAPVSTPAHLSWFTFAPHGPGPRTDWFVALRTSRSFRFNSSPLARLTNGFPFSRVADALCTFAPKIRAFWTAPRSRPRASSTASLRRFHSCSGTNSAPYALAAEKASR